MEDGKQMKLKSYESLLIETQSKDGTSLRRFRIEVKKMGGLKVVELGDKK